LKKTWVKLGGATKKNSTTNQQATEGGNTRLTKKKPKTTRAKRSENVPNKGKNTTKNKTPQKKLKKTPK